MVGVALLEAPVCLCDLTLEVVDQQDRGGDVLGGFEGVELVDKDPADELCR